MWIEAIVTRDDLAELLRQLLPLKIHFDDTKKDRWLYLDRPTEIELVADKGLRMSCPGELMWTVSVVNVPIKLSTIRVLLRPEIITKQRGDVLAFNLQLEESDLVGIPSIIDHTIMKAVNEALVHRELAWDFTKTLTHTVAMPKMLEPIDSLSIGVEWGKRRLDDEALVLVVSFKLAFNRGD